MTSSRSSISTINEHFNFLALGLVPQQRYSGHAPSARDDEGREYRASAAHGRGGTGSTVGISLWVIGEGRYEPQNYGSFIIDDNDLGWDVPNQTSNYKAVRAALTAKGNNSVWDRGSTFLNTNQLYSAVVYSSGNTSSSQPAVRTARTTTICRRRTAPATSRRRRPRCAGDLDLPLPADAATRVTRMRADLATALSRDLLLTASQDRSLLSNTHQLFRCGLPGDPSSRSFARNNAVPPRQRLGHAIGPAGGRRR